MTFFLIMTWLFIGLALYVYIGYPLLIWLISRVRSRPVDKAPITPNLTMIIPTFNEEDVIRRKVENSLALDYPKDKLEILVIDDNSSDTTAEIVSEYVDQGICFIQKPERRGKMSSLEIGFEKAQGDIVVLSDASPSYAGNALRLLARCFNDPSVGVVVGTLAVWDTENAVAKPAGLYWKYEAALRRWESKLGSTVAMHGNMYAIRKHLFRRFAENTINDEWSITMRAIQQGYRAVYEPEAISYDHVSQKMKDEFKRRVRINAGRYQAFFSNQNLWPTNHRLVIFEIISHKLFRLLLPLFMLGALIANILTVLFPSAPLLMWVVLAGQIGFYGFALWGYLSERGVVPKSGNIITKLADVAYYITSSNIASLYGFLRYLRGRQSVLWDKAKQDVSA